MKSVVVCGFAILTALAFASENSLTFEGAKKIWEASRARSDYQTYASEFVQFSNHFHIDEKNDCYSLSKDKEPLELMLVISHQAGERYAVVEQVLANVENEKTQCFRKSYGGLPTKAPPFLPFVLQMRMG